MIVSPRYDSLVALVNACRDEFEKFEEEAKTLWITRIYDKAVSSKRRRKLPFSSPGKPRERFNGNLSCSWPTSSMKMI